MYYRIIIFLKKKKYTPRYPQCVWENNSKEINS